MESESGLVTQYSLAFWWEEALGPVDIRRRGFMDLTHTPLSSHGRSCVFSLAASSPAPPPWPPHLVAEVPIWRACCHRIQSRLGKRESLCVVRLGWWLV